MKENPARSAKLAHCLAQQGAVFKTVGEGWGLGELSLSRMIFFFVRDGEKEKRLELV